ncbi:MAG: N-(5'-phosphoribosyl)anthranilate isomerase [Bacteroidetes bacterium]|nr:N-(5'-phosphoribosyl)anthranilate isomerase [Fibrella sp.]
MALQTTVKISNVTNLSDARYCAGMGVDLLGFAMDTHAPNYVDPVKFAAIRSWVAGVQIVGETTSTDPEQIDTLLRTYEPDLLQVDEAAMLPHLSQLGRPLILRVNLSQLTLDQLDTLLATTHASVEYFLLESPAPVHLDDDLRARLQRLAARYPLLLGFGIGPGAVQTLLSELPTSGLALTGGDETSPGNRDFGELMAVLEAIEVDG